MLPCASSFIAYYNGGRQDLRLTLGGSRSWRDVIVLEPRLDVHLSLFAGCQPNTLGIGICQESDHVVRTQQLLLVFSA